MEIWKKMWVGVFFSEHSVYLKSKWCFLTQCCLLTTDTLLLIFQNLSWNSTNRNNYLRQLESNAGVSAGSGLVIRIVHLKAAALGCCSYKKTSRHAVRSVRKRERLWRKRLGEKEMGITPRWKPSFNSSIVCCCCQTESFAGNIFVPNSKSRQFCWLHAKCDE